MSDYLLTEFGFIGLETVLDKDIKEGLEALARYILGALYKISPETPMLSIHAIGLSVVDIEVIGDEYVLWLDIAFKEEFLDEPINTLR